MAADDDCIVLPKPDDVILSVLLEDVIVLLLKVGIRLVGLEDDVSIFKVEGELVVVSEDIPKTVSLGPIVVEGIVDVSVSFLVTSELLIPLLERVAVPLMVVLDVVAPVSFTAVWLVIPLWKGSLV